jgi:tetratricopeptide (TPR) repeat protein
LDYLTRTFVPTKLAVFYPYPIEIPWAKAAGAAILLLLVFALAVRQLQQRPWLFVGWSWFVGTLVPVIGLVQVGMQASADRYTYIPHFGLLICIVWGAFELLPLLRISPQTVATTFGLAIAGALFLTTQQVRLWQNDELLFGHAKDVTERNYVAMTIYGRQLADRGRHEDALAYYQKVLEMQPRYAGGYYVIGDVYRDAGRTNDALASYSEAIRLDPFHAEALNSRGALLTHLGRPEEAVADFVKAIEAVPVFDVPRLNLGVVLKEQGKLSEAAEVFEAYLKVNPNSAKALALLGDIEFRQNHFPQSQKHYQQALRLEPGNFAAGYGLGCVYVATRRFQEAEAALLKVISIEKRRPEAYFQLGVAQTALGKADEAVSSLWHAVEMLPSSALYRYHLAAALQAAGRKSEALNAYEETLRLKRDFPEPLNNLAWILAADPDPAIRNGPRAVELAERACDLTQHREALLIGTLAAAYAEAGRFPDAIATAQKAIDLATAAGQPAIATRNRELLELYRAGQPYHEPTQ